jgi:hypothetical protein
MAKQEINFEVTSCTLLANGDVLISPHRASGILAIVLGLPIALITLWMLISEPGRFCSIGIFGPALGGALTYVGIRALTASRILIDAGNRLVRVGKGGSPSGRTRSFDALEVGEQPVDVTVIEFGFSFVRAKLHFDDGSSLLLFATADAKKAQEAVHWLQAALTR